MKATLSLSLNPSSSLLSCLACVLSMAWYVPTVERARSPRPVTMANGWMRTRSLKVQRTPKIRRRGPITYWRVANPAFT